MVLRFSQSPLPETAEVRLTVLFLMGREVARLVDGARSAGQYNIQFRADSLPSGTHLYRLEAGDFMEVKRMVLVK